jgi:hypothetical protein
MAIMAVPVPLPLNTEAAVEGVQVQQVVGEVAARPVPEVPEQVTASPELLPITEAAVVAG